jgi:uncharacterized protein
MKKTIVLGASPDPTRYSHIATTRLKQAGHEVIPIGVRSGEIDGLAILKGSPAISGIHTITLYLNPERQKEYYNYILSLEPKRIIFNPGTENAELMNIATAAGIHCEVACTLVLLSTSQY